jgi:hypothetical protein
MSDIKSKPTLVTEPEPSVASTWRGAALAVTLAFASANAGSFTWQIFAMKTANDPNELAITSIPVARQFIYPGAWLARAFVKAEQQPGGIL